MEKQNQNELTTQLHKPSENLKTTDLIAQLVRQSYDMFQTYGRTPEQLTSLTKGFCQVLIKYEQQKIRSAFKIWLEDNTTMPTPADIRKVINIHMGEDRKEEAASEEEREKYHDLPEEQQKEFDAMMDNMRTGLKPESKKKRVYKADQTTFADMPTDQAEVMKALFRKAHENLKETTR